MWVLEVILLGLECCNLGELLLSDCSNFYMIHSTVNIYTLFSEAIADYSYCASKAITCRYRMLGDILQEYNTLISHIRITFYALQRASDMVLICLNYVLMTLLSKLGFHVVSVCEENAHSLSQEEVDYLMALAAKCLSLGINSDATSVRLKLCELGTMLGDYDLTDICLQRICDQNIRCMFSGTLLGVYTLGSNCNSCVKKPLTERYKIKELLQNHLSYSVVYLPSEISIAPITLRMEMFRSIGTLQAVSKDEHWYDWAVLDSCMCLYIFQYLNFVRLEKERFQHVAMNNSIHMIRAEPKIPHRETGLNLVGYSFMREEQLRNASICFFISLKIRPHNNAAKFFLGILFRKANCTRGRVKKAD